MLSKAYRLLSVTLLLALAADSQLALSSFADERSTTFDANAPEKSGYKLVFSDDFSNPSTIDVNNTRRPGFNWYMYDFYWWHASRPDSVSFDHDGITITDHISTATGTGKDKTELVGHGWSGGAYFEALLRFDPDKVVVEDGNWPAFFGLSWQVASKTDQAPGKPPGYQHFAEIDFLEYGFWNHRNHPANRSYFWQIMHDWYGVKSVTCHGDDDWCGISNNATTGLMRVADIGGWHRYGARWVVGDATHKSFVQAYFDGAPIAKPVYWPSHRRLEDVPVPPTKADAYSITDFTKFIIVLQANNKAPVTVRSVKVWQ